MQCVGASVTAIGAASGIRAYLAMRAPTWLTRGLLQMITGALFGVALIVASVSFA